MDEDEKGGFLSSIIGERGASALSSGFKAYGALFTGDLKGFKEHLNDYGQINQEAREEQHANWSRRREEGQAFKKELRDQALQGDLKGVVSTYQDRLQEVVGRLRGEGGQQMEESCNQSHPAPSPSIDTLSSLSQSPGFQK